MAKPQLYQLGISPSCQRVAATLAYKNVDYEPIEIDIRQTGFFKACLADGMTFPA